MQKKLKIRVAFFVDSEGNYDLFSTSEKHVDVMAGIDDSCTHGAVDSYTCEISVPIPVVKKIKRQPKPKKVRHVEADTK